MRNRDYKEFAPDSYFHVFNRGTGQINIFNDDEDYLFFLHRLKEALFPNLKLSSPESAMKSNRYERTKLPSNSFTLISYCLMPNHFHLLIRQNKEISISDLVSKICTSYSKCFNKKNERIGSLFQDQFKAVPIFDDNHLMYLSAYIHQNPVMAGLVKNLDDYQYSSYPDYSGKRNGILCDQKLILSMFDNKRKAYLDFVEDTYDIIKRNKELNKLIFD